MPLGGFYLHCRETASWLCSDLAWVKWPMTLPSPSVPSSPEAAFLGQSSEKSHRRIKTHKFVFFFASTYVEKSRVLILICFSQASCFELLLEKESSDQAHVPWTSFHKSWGKSETSHLVCPCSESLCSLPTYSDWSKCLQK